MVKGIDQRAGEESSKSFRQIAVAPPLMPFSPELVGQGPNVIQLCNPGLRVFESAMDHRQDSPLSFVVQLFLARQRLMVLAPTHFHQWREILVN